MGGIGKVDFIIVTSDEPWNEIWHTQLHYANQLSRYYKVIFLGPPKPWSIKNLFSFKQLSKAINDKLDVVTYHNFLPAFLGKASLYLNDRINGWLLKKQLKGKGIIWHFDPHRSYYLFRNSSKYLHIFHVIDPIVGCNLDPELSMTSDLIIVTSPRFTGHYEGIHKNVIQIGQGVDVDFYREEDPETSDTLVSKDSILLLGTITDQIHFQNLIAIAEAFPGKLVLIGPDHTTSEKAKSEFRQLLELPGVQWFGPMPPWEFRKHLKVCKVGIISYDISVNYKNDFRSPLKVISYLACDKCVISNIKCEIDTLLNKGIYEVETLGEYIDLIKAGFSGNLEFDKVAVEKYLQSKSYKRLLAQIHEKLQLDFPPAQ